MAFLIEKGFDYQSVLSMDIEEITYWVGIRNKIEEKIEKEYENAQSTFY